MLQKHCKELKINIMKGILKSNINNEWFVWYTNIKNSNVYEKVLPLIRDFSNWVYYNPTDGIEVEFEIIICQNQPELLKLGYVYGSQLAKLVAQQEELPNESFNMLMKGYEQESWDEVYEKWLNNGIIEDFEPYNLLKWLKEHYNTPIKK